MPAAAPFTVLVATDFSPSAEAAVEWGGELARARQGRVTVVHALDLHGPLSDFLPSPPDLEEHFQGAAVERLEQVATALRERGIEVTTQLAIGVASQAIVQTAASLAPDLLVQGSRGLTGVAHLLLGSTAQRIVQRATCPVLTVHRGDRERHPHLRHVLVPTDFSHDAEGAARTARALLAPGGGSRLTLLHAYHLPIEYTAYGTIPTALPFTADVAAIAEEKLAAAAAALGGDGVTVDTIAREGYPPDVIVEVAAETGADVVAMGTHGRTGLRHLLLGSNAERVVGHAPCPVLTVRQPER